MAVKQYGKAALQLIKEFRSRKWFGASFIDFANKISKEYSARSEVLYGCVVSTGANMNATNLEIDVTVGEIMLAGKVHPVAVLNDEELRAATKLVYSDGSDASGVSFSGNDNFIGIIACNSGADGDPDNLIAEGSAPLIIGVINGTSGTGTATAGPSSAVIATALSNTVYNKHDGTSGWTYLAVVQNKESATSLVTSNINNHLGL